MHALKATLLSIVGGAFLVASVACEDTPKPPKAASKAAAGLKVLAQGSDALGNGNAAKPPPPPPPPPAANDGEGGDEDVAEIAYAYSPIGKRDPFRSLFAQVRDDEGGQQLTELQKFEIDQLRLVAIVSRIATPYAMVEDPSSKGHTLTRGTLIGKNWGRVAQINGECVVIKEEYRDYTGRKVTNKTDMCLPKPPELKLD